MADPHSRFVQDYEENRNGHFTLENREGRAVLTVHPPGRNGRPVALRDVESRLGLFSLEGYDENELREIVLGADGTPYDICEWREPEPVEGVVHITLSSDAMEARMEVEPPRYGGSWPREEALRERLREEGVVYGILDESLRTLAEGRSPGETPAVVPSGESGSAHPRLLRKIQGVVARGTPSRSGTDGRIVHSFDPHPRARPAPEGEGPSDRVDFKNLNVIQSCEAGDLLAGIAPPLDGEAGRNVRGEILPVSESRHAKLEAGKNTALSEDGLRLLSLIRGQVKASPRSSQLWSRIDVEEVLHLTRVDFSTGHVKFPGTVVIQETVVDGFQVEAEGDILIQKSVGNVRIVSEGDVVLYGGVVSRGDAFVQAKGDIYARFAEGATLHAGGSLYIEEAAMHSRLTAGRDITIDSGRGEMIGGTALSARLFRAKKIGARVGSLTRITVGLDPETMESLRRLEEEYDEKRRTLRKAEQHIGQIEEKGRRGREVTGEEQETLNKLKTIRASFEEALNNLDRQREKIYGRIESDPDASVEALEALYPGVEVSFGAGARKYRVEGEPSRKYCRFILEGEVVVLRHSDL